MLSDTRLQIVAQSLSPYRLRAHAAVGLLVAILSLAGCGSPDASDGDGSAKGDSSTPEAEQSKPAGPPSTEEILQRMVAAYQNASSYSDRGVFHLRVEPDTAQISQTVPFSLAFERPGKIYLEAYQVQAISDGKLLHAALRLLPDRVVEIPAPEKLTIGSLYNDRIQPLALVPPGQRQHMPPQLVLLLEEEPLPLLLSGARDPELVEERGKILDREYYRIQAKTGDDVVELWIDSETYVLRRMVYPTNTDRLAIEAATETRLDSISLIADFEDAKIDGTIDAKAFAFAVPENAKRVRFFVLPNPAELLGEKVHDFQFTDLAGNPVTSQSLTGKIVVLNLWGSYAISTIDSLTPLGAAYEKFRDDDRIAWLAVSVDDSTVESDALKKIAERLNVEVPIVRDLRQDAANVLHTRMFPSILILDRNGVMQDYYPILSSTGLAEDLVAKVNRLLDGENIYQEARQAYQNQLKEHEQRLDQGPQTPAERTDPKKLKLASLFGNMEIRAPGNILAVEPPDGPPRLLVVDEFHAIVEVGLDGEILARHELDIDPQQEYITTLRTAVAPDGKRYYIAFGLFTAQQRCHLLDDKFQILASYPKDALENNHAGIGDVQLADLDGDGKMNLYVGYLGAVGVQAASIDGERLWSHRSVGSIQQLAVAGPNERGSHYLICADTTDTLTTIAATGNAQARVQLAGRRIVGIVAADLDADGATELCILAFDASNERAVVGLNLKGEELWSHPMPQGIHQHPIERIIAGRLFAEGPRQWLLPGPDGSIQIIAPDGQLLDRFNYGVLLSGLATTHVDGKPVLVVSSRNGLEAWKVE